MYASSELNRLHRKAYIYEQYVGVSLIIIVASFCLLMTKYHIICIPVMILGSFMFIIAYSKYRTYYIEIRHSEIRMDKRLKRWKDTKKLCKLHNDIIEINKRLALLNN